MIMYRRLRMRTTHQNDVPERVETVIIGGGQAGLSVGYHLARRGRRFVILEANTRVGDSWRTRWDSLRLLTPNWMTRLPGFAYRGDDPDDYMTAPQVARLITGYAAGSGAPVLTGTTVTAVRPRSDGYAVLTDRGAWHARTADLLGLLH
jgi:putative flavoprotein involved in K+ transport